MRLLVVEDEMKLASFICHGFKQENYGVDLAHDGESGAYLAETHEYDLMILDLMLPKISGLEVLCRVKQRKPGLPILILTAKGALDDRVKGLDLGAGDYMVKPFAFVELSARVRALLRRGTHEASELQVADLIVNTATRTVSRAGRRIELSSKEFALLEFLMRNAKRTLPRRMIIENVWGVHFYNVTNVVDVYINYLRNKLDTGCSLQLIRTVRGVGYTISDGQP